MDFSRIEEAVLGAIRFVKGLSVQEILDWLATVDLHAMTTDPRFLGFMAVIAVVALFKRWHLLLASILSVAGFTLLLQYTAQQGGGGAELSSERLLLFAGGGVVIVIAFIYLLFFRSE